MIALILFFTLEGGGAPNISLFGINLVYALVTNMIWFNVSLGEVRGIGFVFTLGVRTVRNLY